MLSVIKNFVANNIPPSVINNLLAFYYTHKPTSNNLRITKHKHYLDFINQRGECIRMSRRHVVYTNDVLNSFDYYFSAVQPLETGNQRMVDYSTPRFHEVVGFDLHPVIFPSFAEPLVTANQYVDFAKLTEGAVVLDLGAYSGLTSILFDKLVGEGGCVVAVDADPVNAGCIEKNFGYYKKVTGRTIRFMEGAVWNHNEGVFFSSEGNMGSSATSYVGEFRGSQRKVRTFTLSEIAAKCGLKRIDFIKCDIEGAEQVIFGDVEFFKSYRPRIIIEPHWIEGKLTTSHCIEQLGCFGYQCKEIKQQGVNLPLLECYPS